MIATPPIQYRQGQHICALYETREERIAVAAAYLAEGLRLGERCLYAGPTADDLQRLRRRLDGLEIDVTAAERAKALLLETNAEVHLVDGRFDAERMLGLLAAAVERALNDGFAGLRTCGDMSWLLDRVDGAHQVVEYEAVLNQFFRNVCATGMCQYDCRRLPAGLLECAGIVNHPSVVIDERHRPNPFFAESTPPGLDGRGVAAKLAALRRS